MQLSRVTILDCGFWIGEEEASATDRALTDRSGAQLRERDLFDLSDTLLGQTQSLPHLFERCGAEVAIFTSLARIPHRDAVVRQQHLALAIAEAREHLPHLV